MGEDCYHAVTEKYGAEIVNQYDFSKLEKQGEKSSYAGIVNALKAEKNKP
ncbi:hypothetical protein [Sinanaerobacter sp. ZZT-01]|nr:hypothetical protein [Sinanaerobacter sp. ZZT-01]WRR93285.1 hypothetical protein U5921_14830 [Sinanaerobacter sp. ZZT-01]